jgi:aminoglycoside phosphotransferase (APT) family kinase protein
MTEFTTSEKFAQLVQKIDPQSKLLRAWELKGGISAQVTALEIEQSDGQIKKMLVRQHGAVDLKQNPQIAADEFRLLQLLQSVGLATPAPYHLDLSGEIFATPSIVIEYIEGKTEFAPANKIDFLLQLATHLARIHRVNGSQLDLSFLPQQEKRVAEKLRERLAQIAASSDEGGIRDALEAARPFAQQNTSVLLHGDFWPGNILWRDGQLVAVIDWEDAAIGDPLADLANSRLEILWAFDIEAMQDFTHQYQLMTAIDFAQLPYWDLWAALRSASFATWATNAIAAQSMRAKFHWFVTQARAQM